jgi:hypothetical protein
VYGVKMDNYNADYDDVIVFTVVLMVTDNTVLIDQANLSALSTVTFGSVDVPTKTFLNQFTVKRTGLEKPELTLETNILNPNITYVKKYVLC